MHLQHRVCTLKLMCALKCIAIIATYNNNIIALAVAIFKNKSSVNIHYYVITEA